jgi:hypothetical protein
MGQALITLTGDSNIMASTEIRLYARISELRTVPGVTSWESVAVPAHKNKSDTQHARELSKADPTSVYAVYAKYTSIIRMAYFNGLEFTMTSDDRFAPLTLAKTAWEGANTGDASYSMWVLGHDGKFRFHLRSHSLPFMKAIGRTTYGPVATHSKTWYIVDASGKQVLGRFDGKQTKENVVAVVEERQKAEAARKAALITTSLNSLRTQILNGERDLKVMLALGVDRLTARQITALETLAKAMRDAHSALGEEV